MVSRFLSFIEKQKNLRFRYFTTTIKQTVINEPIFNNFESSQLRSLASCRAVKNKVILTLMKKGTVAHYTGYLLKSTLSTLNLPQTFFWSLPSSKDTSSGKIIIFLRPRRWILINGTNCGNSFSFFLFWEGTSDSSTVRHERILLGGCLQRTASYYIFFFFF